MKRKNPPLIKIYEALGTIGDKRLELETQDTGLFWSLDTIQKAKVTSSLGSKYYIVTRDPTKNAIMANDNASYRQWYLGYPSIAMLLTTWALPLDPLYAEQLKDIKRGAINKKYKDHHEGMAYVESLMQEKGIDLENFHHYVSSLAEKIEALSLDYLGAKKPPPQG